MSDFFTLRYNLRRWLIEGYPYPEAPCNRSMSPDVCRNFLHRNINQVGEEVAYVTDFVEFSVALGRDLYDLPVGILYKSLFR